MNKAEILEKVVNETVEASLAFSIACILKITSMDLLKCLIEKEPPNQEYMRAFMFAAEVLTVLEKKVFEKVERETGKPVEFEKMLEELQIKRSRDQDEDKTS